MAERLTDHPNGMHDAIWDGSEAKLDEMGSATRRGATGPLAQCPGEEFHHTKKRVKLESEGLEEFPG